jgi:hypothetical protein
LGSGTGSDTGMEDAVADRAAWHEQGMPTLMERGPVQRGPRSDDRGLVALGWSERNSVVFYLFKIMQTGLN